MNDTIKVKVNEDGKWFQYELTYEEMDYIKPVLKSCKNKKECTFDPEDPSTSMEILKTVLMPFGSAQQNGKKGIIYNLNELPKEMTKEQVEDIYQRKGILYIRSKKTPTQQIN